MVTDPPYGVDYRPDWRGRAGVNANTGKMGRVANDDRADWREAWALFPGSVAYVWHAGRFASVVQDSLQASGFDIRAQIVWAKDRFALSRGHYHWQHEPCQPAGTMIQKVPTIRTKASFAVAGARSRDSVSASSTASCTRSRLRGGSLVPPRSTGFRCASTRMLQTSNWSTSCAEATGGASGE
jgi:hypothetical protein